MTWRFLSGGGSSRVGRFRRPGGVGPLVATKKGPPVSREPFKRYFRRRRLTIDRPRRGCATTSSWTCVRCDSCLALLSLLGPKASLCLASQYAPDVSRARVFFRTKHSLLTNTNKCSIIEQFQLKILMQRASAVLIVLSTCK